MSPTGRSWVWRGECPTAEVAFFGKGGDETAEELLAQLQPDRNLAYLTQVHSATALPGAPGNCGEGDALFTTRSDLGLAVVTADCVPILFAAEGLIAAAHAGWRGIVAGIVPETLRRLAVPAPRIQAWIGPAIGPCCYEVGGEVADRVANVSGPQVVLRREGRERPFLDLHEAVAIQLATAGLERVERISHCTKCAAEDLWSYRREGPGRGRNRALIWRKESMPGPVAPAWEAGE